MVRFTKLEGRIGDDDEKFIIVVVLLKIEVVDVDDETIAAEFCVADGDV